jgi:methionyl-tRNA formyltransferase
MRALIQAGHKIDLLITITPELAKKNMVAGFMDLRNFADENNIPFYIAESYSLKSEKDKEVLQDIEIRLLLVIGWQRLIPEWLLSRLVVGAFGMHGSSHALPYGRGRSPMNWSIIQNKDTFISNLFKYSPGVDDGDILDTQMFDITPFDSGRTMHYKSTLAMISLLKKNFTKIITNDFQLKKQMDVKPTYYPKRTEEDGNVFWDRDSLEIHNLVRAVTRPFHGAFTFYDGRKIMIWGGHPFDTRLFDPYIYPGTILHIFVNGDIIVKTADGSYIITEYELPDGLTLAPDEMFTSGLYEYKNPYVFPS